MEQAINIVLLFFAFSIVGWCIEVILKYRQFHRFINRGFLFGPVLPIYGTGAVLITLSVWALAGLESSVGTTFVISFLVCGTVEYLTSLFMEKRYHARWWDYSTKPMNLHGRVWIGNLILFGLGGVIIIELANPLFFKIMGGMPLWVKEVLAGILVCIFLADTSISHFVMRLLKTGIEKSEADNTEEIGSEIREMFRDRNIFYRRFADAYPEVIYRTDRIKARMETIRQETEKLREEAEQRMDELKSMIAEEKEQLAINLEPTRMVKNNIIENQSKLIDLLYDESKATPEMAELKKLIEQKNSILKERTQRIEELREHIKL